MPHMRHPRATRALPARTRRAAFLPQELAKKDAEIAEQQLKMEDMAVEFGEIAEMGFDPDLTGFTDEELAGLFAQPDFAPGTEDEQGKLDKLAPKMVTCPHCGEDFDVRLQEG